VLLEETCHGILGRSIDKLPTFRWKTPLQRVCQLLKRHRDIDVQKESEAQPISIIITTLAARAYRGRGRPWRSTRAHIGRDGEFVNQAAPRIPNPVNPAEDFADKWSTEEGRKKRLEENFTLG